MCPSTRVSSMACGLQQWRWASPSRQQFCPPAMPPKQEPYSDGDLVRDLLLECSRSRGSGRVHSPHFSCQNTRCKVLKTERLGIFQFEAKLPFSWREKDWQK